MAKVYPDLVQYDKQGKPFTVYYHLLTPMLLNELQKEHGQNVAMKAEIAALKQDKARIASLETRLEKLTALVDNTHDKESAQTAAYTQH